LKSEYNEEAKDDWRAVSYSGIGIHTGQEVTLTFCPAKPGKGIFFRRSIFQESQSFQPHLSMFSTLQEAPISVSKMPRIYTVEHVLAAVRAYEIDQS